MRYGNRGRQEEEGWAHDEWVDRPEVRYRYAGKEWDEESGLYYFGARYYRAEVGLHLKP